MQGLLEICRNESSINDELPTLRITTRGKTIKNLGPDYRDVAKVILSPDIQKIDEDTFIGYDHLTAIELPDGLVSIGNRAFKWCSSLNDFTIPDSVTEIGESAFYDCSSLQSINLSLIHI